MSVSEKLTIIAENEQNVYNAGKKAEWDDFWDSLQDNGNRTHYAYAFAYGSFNKHNFKPKYPIICTENGYATPAGNSLFRQTTDASVTQFYEDMIEEINVPITIMGQPQFVFDYMLKLKKIIELNVTVTTTFNSWFRGCEDLEYIRWGSSVIGQSLDMYDCKKLDKNSIIDTYTHLSDTASDKTLTLSKTAVNTAFGISIDDSNTWPEGSEYYNLRYSKRNWSVAYNR